MDDLLVEVRRWLLKADRDRQAVACLLEREPPLADLACYHAQQCAEKALKAVTAYHRQPLRRTHELEPLRLQAMAAAPRLDVPLEDVLALTDYAAETRYPDVWREIPLAEAAIAQAAAERVWAAVLDHLPPATHPSRSAI
jgi:HEPN domain-containing protein